MVFENLELDLEELPKVEALEFIALAKNYLKVAYISTTVLFGVLLIGGLAMIWYKNLWSHSMFIGIAIGGLLSLYILFMLLARAEYKIQGYALREKDVLYRSGVIFRSETVVPFNRVQHCEIKQGPIQRMFDLKTLEVFTAGGAKSDLRVPGLEAEMAQQLKEFIIKTVGKDEKLES